MSMVQPFHDRDGVIWFDGKMVPWRDAKLHVLTHGLHYAGAVFEGLKAYNGKIFKLREHTERFFRSAELLDYSIPYTMDEIDTACKATITDNKLSNAYLRPVAWRGTEMMAIGGKGTTIHVAIASWESSPYYGEEIRTRGLKMHISRWARPAPNTIPCAAKASGLYMICTMSKQEAEAEGLDDALMLDYRGLIAEATGANFFMFLNKGTELHTPSPECFLNGITRLTVMELAKQAGYKVVERHIKPEELADAEEVFLTGTAYEIMPVGQIGDYKYPVGANTKKLMDAYSKAVGREVKAAAA